MKSLITLLACIPLFFFVRCGSKNYPFDQKKRIALLNDSLFLTDEVQAFRQRTRDTIPVFVDSFFQYRRHFETGYEDLEFDDNFWPVDLFDKTKKYEQLPVLIPDSLRGVFRYLTDFSVIEKQPMSFVTRSPFLPTGRKHEFVVHELQIWSTEGIAVIVRFQHIYKIKNGKIKKLRRVDLNEMYGGSLWKKGSRKGP